MLAEVVVSQFTLVIWTCKRVELRGIHPLDLNKFL